MAATDYNFYARNTIGYDLECEAQGKSLAMAQEVF